jgi:hypothetical protein
MEPTGDCGIVADWIKLPALSLLISTAITAVVATTDVDRNKINTWLVQAIKHYPHASWRSPNNIAVLAEVTVSHQQSDLMRD